MFIYQRCKNLFTAWGEKMEKMAVTDVTHLFIDENKTLAREFNLEDKYKMLSKSGIKDHHIKKQFKKLAGYQVDFVAKKIHQEQPYKGSKETIDILHQAGYSVFGITDNPLLSVPEIKTTIKEKLPFDEIYPTSIAEVNDGKFNGTIRKYKSKPDILSELVRKYKPANLFGMVQGKNDLDIGYSIKKYDGYLFTVNSNCPELKSISDFHIEHIEYAPKILPKLLKEINY